MDDKTKVFISYKHDDNAHFPVSYLVDRLLIEGINGVWFDGYISVGTKWMQELDDKLSECEALIAVITPNYQGSHYCNYEWALAKGRGVRIFPVKVHTDSMILPPLDSFQFIDSSKEAKNSTTLLIETIKSYLDSDENHHRKSVEKTVTSSEIQRILMDIVTTYPEDDPADMYDIISHFHKQKYITNEQLRILSDLLSK